MIGVVYDMIDFAYWDEMQYENLALCFGLCMRGGFGRASEGLRREYVFLTLICIWCEVRSREKGIVQIAGRGEAEDCGARCGGG